MLKFIVAYALVRAASRLVSMLVPGAIETSDRHRQECRRGTHECVRHKPIQPHASAWGYYGGALVFLTQA
jgi:hypothetical protein